MTISEQKQLRAAIADVLRHVEFLEQFQAQVFGMPRDAQARCVDLLLEASAEGLSLAQEAERLAENILGPPMIGNAAESVGKTIHC